MAQQGFIQAPEMDWMENAGLYSRLQTWQRDTEFIFRGLLSKETTKAKVNYLMCWLRQAEKSSTLTEHRI